MIPYNAAISACEKGQQTITVPRLFQKWELRGLLRTVITYDAAISADEKSQKSQHALPMFQKLQLRGPCAP